jgi:biopolymer transport protein ExbB/TolQ
MSELDLSLLIAIPALFFGLVAWAGAASANTRLSEAHKRAAQLQQELELVRQSISGLTAGAVGMDQRMLRLEAREKALSERQETYENQQSDEQPYGHAIRLVQQGAGVGRLIDELDLSESEADLIVRLHGQRESA